MAKTIPFFSSSILLENLHERHMLKNASCGFSQIPRYQIYCRTYTVVILLKINAVYGQYTIYILLYHLQKISSPYFMILSLL